MKTKRAATLQDQIKKKYPGVDRKTLRLATFKRWIETVPGDRLIELLCRAIWHDTMLKTELNRFFTLETEYNTKMIPRDERKWRVKRCTAAGCDWFGLSRRLMRKCPECRGEVVEALLPAKEIVKARTLAARRAVRRKKK